MIFSLAEARFILSHVYCVLCLPQSLRRPEDHRQRDQRTRLEGLFRELGRRVSETEAYDWYQTRGKAAGVRGV